MKKLIGPLLFSSLLTACGDPQCGPTTYSSLTITPASSCLTVDLPTPLTEREPCTGTIVTIHNACSDAFVVDSNSAGDISDLLTEIAPGTDAEVDANVGTKTSKVTPYTVRGTLGAQSVTISFVGTDS
jgi:hypothetical protein